MQELIVQEIPLFNIWDCISFIYTVCAEGIETPLDAQLHLVQFHIIIGSLRAVDDYFPRFAGPTTVAATWTASTQPHPYTIAFATTCVGDSKNAKARMALARQKFMATITSQLKKVPKGTPRDAPNKPGNCPEYQVWGVVCRKEGKYTSLCFNMDTDPGGKIYQCCGRCDDMRELLGANKIEIEDFWMNSVTGDSSVKANFETTYPFRILKPVEDIIAEFLKR